MSEQQDTQEPLKPDATWDNGVTTPKKVNTAKPPSRGGKKATPTEDQSQALTTRISNAQTLAQRQFASQAVEFADVASDQVINQAIPLIGLNIAEKAGGAIAAGGSLATAFLRSTATTGMQIESAFEATCELEDPLYQALMLTGA